MRVVKELGTFWKLLEQPLKNKLCVTLS